MSSLSPCGCGSPLTINTQVPGPTGAGGALPITTTASFIIPAVGATVTIAVISSSGFEVNQNVFVGGANFLVTAIPGGGVSVTLKTLGFSGDAAVGATVASGSVVEAGTGNITIAPTASNILPVAALVGTSPITDNTGGTIGTSFPAAGVGYQTLTFSHTFIGGTTAVTNLNAYTFGYRFKILSWSWVSSVLLVGGGGSRVFNMLINATQVGTVPSTVTVVVGSGAVGTIIAGTAVSGAQTGGQSDTFSIQVANGGTAFSAGSGYFLVQVQNLDTVNALSTVTGLTNTILNAIS